MLKTTNVSKFYVSVLSDVCSRLWVAWFAWVDCFIGRFCKAVQGRPLWQKQSLGCLRLEKGRMCVRHLQFRMDLSQTKFTTVIQDPKYITDQFPAAGVPVLPSSSVMPNFRQIYWGMPRVPESTRTQIYRLENWGDGQGIRPLTIWLLAPTWKKIYKDTEDHPRDRMENRRHSKPVNRKIHVEVDGFPHTGHCTAGGWLLLGRSQNSLKVQKYTIVSILWGILNLSNSIQ